LESAVPPSREYRSEVRAEAARATRARVLDAAERLFLAQGYPATTMAAIAREAGVSGQTVYNAFGSKAALLKSLYDVRLVGDDEPVPFGRRPEVQALAAETDPRALIRRYLGLGAVLFGRIAPLVRLIGDGAAAGDPDLRALVETTGRERLFGTTGVAAQLESLGALRVPADEARDVIWCMNSIQVWDLFGRERGWDEERLLDRLTDMIAGVVLKV
jgi:AcrR family transcriptional regulator